MITAQQDPGPPKNAVPDKGDVPKKAIRARQAKPTVELPSDDDDADPQTNKGNQRCDWYNREEDKDGKIVAGGKICKYIVIFLPKSRHRLSRGRRMQWHCFTGADPYPIIQNIPHKQFVTRRRSSGLTNVRRWRNQWVRWSLIFQSSTPQLTWNLWHPSFSSLSHSVQRLHPTHPRGQEQTHLDDSQRIGQGSFLDDRWFASTIGSLGEVFLSSVFISALLFSRCEPHVTSHRAHSNVASLTRNCEFPKILLVCFCQISFPILTFFCHSIYIICHTHVVQDLCVYPSIMMALNTLKSTRVWERLGFAWTKITLFSGKVT